MHRRVTPPLVEETTASVQVLEVVGVRFAAKYGERSDLEVGPKRALAISERSHAAVCQEANGFARGEKTLPLSVCQPVEYGWPQRGHRDGRFVGRDYKSVQLGAIGEQREWIGVEVTRKVELLIDSHVVVVLEREIVAIEESAEEANHLMIAQHVTLRVLGTHGIVGERLSQPMPVDPIGHVPVFGRYFSELDQRVRVLHNVRSEVLTKFLVVEQHVRIVVLVVEFCVELTYRLDEIVQLLVAD